MNNDKARVAVVGVGVAGLTAAFLLQKRYHVTLFERNDYLGGHTNTVLVDEGDRQIPIDTGFIVCNDQTYPHFHRLLERLNVPVRWSDMSFGYHSEVSGFRYAGTTLNGLFADRTNIVRPSFYRFLWEIRSISRALSTALREDSFGGRTLEVFAKDVGCSTQVIYDYLVPLGAAIWSAPDREMLNFPAETFARFFKNHGLLQLLNRPRWQTVVGGSFCYVKAFEKIFQGDVRTSASVQQIVRSNSNIEVRFGNGEVEAFDKVVLAVHADQALRLLSEPTERERELLGPWRYQMNETFLHTDTSVLSRDPRVWASWNFVRRPASESTRPIEVSYHMNRLQGIVSPRNYCVTLNPTRPLAEESVIRKIEYTHPVYSLASVDTQRYLPELNENGRTFFCGSYFGYGFHEDAVKAALGVACCLGEEL